MTNTHIDIRLAVETDAQWVEDLMDRVLAPYYDGDHRAHAKRIFQAHITGGQDNLGFFSYEQKMFVASLGGRPIGVIHLVGKRQQTYKISPLIVDEAHRGTRGIGKKLLSYAEDYAKSKGARQLYCTVAEGNKMALQFFLRHGFVTAGKSDSHYKADSTEVMLYKPLLTNLVIEKRDSESLSVVPFDDVHAEQVRELLLRELPEHFSGIDDRWVDGLFAGYGRRHLADVNLKYKLIFVVTDSKGKVHGVAAATPKKGTPIKMMPFIADSLVAFEALLNDIPFQMIRYGHKLYLHICPSAPQVISLQRFGWKLDAALPSAYLDGVVTQQWSLDINKDTMRTMRVKRRFFDQIRSGTKTLEVRVCYDTIKSIGVGERIRLVTHDDSFVVRVVDKKLYRTFEEMLAMEEYKHIVPDASSADEVLRILREFYGPEKERLGVMVMKFET